jgi:putative ABC transport system permease protein
VKVSAIDRKLLRDLREMWAQALAIAFVILAGVATYVAMTSVMDALQRSLSTYYAEYAFADGFATVRRAPESVADRLRTVPGVGRVQTRVTAGVNLEVPGFDEPVSGLLVSLPEGEQPALNRVFLRVGRLPEAGRVDDVLLNESFAEAHGLEPGDRLTAIVNGRRRSLRVTGIALSPEFLMQLQPGSFFPDPERYGVLWMGRQALAAAYDMEGAFNDVVFTLAPGALLEDVLDRVDQVLARYGGQGAYGREDQPSHFLIHEEFRSLQGMATMLPTIFLGVAAFLLNIVVTRLVSLQREQIAVLKAFGYRDRDVGLHYLKLVLAIAFVGVVAGSALGGWLGSLMGGLYLEYYRFPSLAYRVGPDVVLVAMALTTGAALVGAVFAVRRAVRLPPAEAMRPAPPARFRPTLVERLGLRDLFDQPTRMILRSLERQPVKSLLTVIGIGSSCAILVMGLFWQDTFDYIVQVQYGLSQREDVTVSFVEPTSERAVYELASLTGVRHAEAFRSVPVRLRYGHRTHRTSIEGIPADHYLRRLLDTDLEPIPIPEGGIVLSEHLGQLLGAGLGDEITVEVLEGARTTTTVPVVGLAQQFLGVAAYMDLGAVNRLVRSGRAISGAFLMIDPLHQDRLMDELRERPRVAAITSQERAIQAYYESSAASILTFTLILSLFAGVIAFGVVYNSARIALSERDRELASLRVLGFTRREVAYILLGELALLVLLALPVGSVLGALVSSWVAEATQTEMYRFPLVLRRGTFAMAAGVVLVAASTSAFIVNRRLRRLDLVGVLKTRE